MVVGRRAAAAEFEMRQFHNQATESPLHKRLVELWSAVESETGGRVKVRTFAENDKIPGGDPAALAMLQAGDLDFFTLMGGVLGETVPATAVQSLPFAFRTNAEVYGALDGDLGDHLRRECETKGIYAVPRGCFENGFRHITATTKPIRTIDDLRDLKIRTPPGAIFTDFFRMLGADPIAIPVNRLYENLKNGVVEAQENPLVIAATFKLYEVQRYVSLTSHSWAGFNLLANLKRWRSLPEDVHAVIERNAAKYVALQRADNQALNKVLQGDLAQRGMIFNTADMTGFRAPLGPFYARWKERVGRTTWALLEAHVGKLD